jgi:putative Ca2+/H+ antiporter (TMEM165/GDT1 family)
MIFEGRIAISAVMLAIFAGMVGYAATFPAEARMLPWVIGIPGLVLCVAQLVTEIRNRPEKQIDPAETRRELMMFGWIAAFILGVLLFGFILAGPVLVAAYLWFDWREQPQVIAISAAICFAILYGVFERALGMDLFPGLVTGWLFG